MNLFFQWVQGETLSAWCAQIDALQEQGQGGGIEHRRAVSWVERRKLESPLFQSAIVDNIPTAIKEKDLEMCASVVVKQEKLARKRVQVELVSDNPRQPVKGKV